MDAEQQVRQTTLKSSLDDASNFLVNTVKDFSKTWIYDPDTKRIAPKSAFYPENNWVTTHPRLADEGAVAQFGRMLADPNEQEKMKQQAIMLAGISTPMKDMSLGKVVPKTIVSKAVPQTKLPAITSNVARYIDDVPSTPEVEMVTVYHASPNMPTKGNWRKGTMFADTEQSARYYAESHHTGDITVQKVEIPKSLVQKNISNNIYNLKEEFPISPSTPEVNPLMVKRDLINNNLNVAESNIKDFAKKYPDGFGGISDAGKSQPEYRALKEAVNKNFSELQTFNKSNQDFLKTQKRVYPTKPSSPEVAPKYQHRMLRTTAESDIESIKANGFDSDRVEMFNKPLKPFEPKFSKQPNVARIGDTSKFNGTKKGEIVLLPPESAIIDGKNGAFIKPGWKPKDSEIVRIEYDGQNPLEIWERPSSPEVTGK